MNGFDVFDQPALERITLALVHFVWQGTAIALVLAALVRLPIWRTSRFRYGLLVGGLMMMVAVPVATFMLIEPPANDLAISPAAGDLGTTWPPETALSAAEIAAFDDTTPITEPAGNRWHHYVFGVWMIGVMVFSGRLLFGAVAVWRWRSRSDLLPAWISDRAAAMVSLARVRVVIRQSSRVAEAVATGIVRPMVIIPCSWLAEMPPDVVEAVIAHELAHVRRWDLWVNLLERVVETMLFYHPAVWWLSRRIRLEREKCCDEWAVSMTGKRLEYARALQWVARRRLDSLQPVLAAAIRGGHHMNLLSRVQNVLGVDEKSSGGRWWPAGCLALVIPLGLWFSGQGTAAPEDGSSVTQDDDSEAPQRASERSERTVAQRRATIRDRVEELEAERLELRQRVENEAREVDYVRRVQGERDAADDGRARRSTGERREVDRTGADDRSLRAMIVELQREVESLRREVREMREQSGRRETSNTWRGTRRSTPDAVDRPAELDRLRELGRQREALHERAEVEAGRRNAERARDEDIRARDEALRRRDVERDRDRAESVRDRAEAVQSREFENRFRTRRAERDQKESGDFKEAPTPQEAIEPDRIRLRERQQRANDETTRVNELKAQIDALTARLKSAEQSAAAAQRAEQSARMTAQENLRRAEQVLAREAEARDQAVAAQQKAMVALKQAEDLRAVQQEQAERLLSDAERQRLHAEQAAKQSRYEAALRAAAEALENSDQEAVLRALEFLRRQTGNESKPEKRDAPVEKVKPSDGEADIDDEAPTVEGVVIEVGKEGLLELSVGRDDGLRAGERLMVFRDDQFLGYAVIKSVSPDHAVGQMVADTKQADVVKGDRFRR